MSTGKKTAIPSHPSLLPLRRALTAAERESPARPRHVDSNERRALQLIARMQAEHKKVFPFVDVKETVDIDA
ncbi:MAG: hypothetical protein HXY35_15755 [Chloroflexi bacterium]|nr:hypothetical protein [Chloroflexota bacterium]